MTRDPGVWAAPDCALVLTVVVGLAEAEKLAARPHLHWFEAVSGWALLGRRGSQVHS